jgi:hypothetical protein
VQEQRYEQARCRRRFEVNSMLSSVFVDRPRLARANEVIE